MAESMKRLDPGHYTITLGGVQYWVTMEKKRVETGKSKKGTEKSVWTAKRDDFVLMESERYRDAKRAVFDDAALPEDQRPQPNSTEAPAVSEPVSEPEPVDQGVVEPEHTDDPVGQELGGDEQVPQAQPQTVADSDNFEQHVTAEPALVPEEVPDQEDNAPHFSWA